MNSLRQKRKELGLTQIEMANICGVSRRTYQTYETKSETDAIYNDLIDKLTKMGIMDGSNVVLSIKDIKRKASKVFSKYNVIDCAFLFGSYARCEADKDSDIDFMVVLNQPIGLDFFGIAAELEDVTGKSVDLITHRQAGANENLLKDILVEGFKIYERQ